MMKKSQKLLYSVAIIVPAKLNILKLDCNIDKISRNI